MGDSQAVVIAEAWEAVIPAVGIPVAVAAGPAVAVIAGGSRPTEGSKIDGKKVLEQVCGETGGRMFEVTKKESVDQIYSSIAEELRAQYILGYTPDKKSTDTGYHKITLTAKKKDLFVQTRQGYYAGE